MKPWRTEEVLPDGRVRVTLRDPREDGELMWPARFPEAEVVKLQNALGHFADSQLEQNPVSREGGVFKEAWIHYWSPAGSIPGTVSLPALGSSLMSFDFSFRGDESSDPSCGTVWRRAGGRFFLLDSEWGRFDFPESLAAVRRLIGRWPRVLGKLVENKANGPAVVSTLQVDFPGFIEVTPEGGKESRANAVAPLFQAGLVFLPHPTLFPWVGDAVHELLRFPRGAHDDFVDSTTQALLHMNIEGSRLVDVMTALHRDPSMRKILGA